MNAPAEPQTFAQSAIPVHEAQTLTQGGQVAHIRLNDQLYALRITRAGKLILTK
ncbi:Hemin uptake protein HemP [Gemmobacter megaterium]|uniref:Hemin uptake protein HemP n=1 Tax=Gemmobacter megaterium TaxID=1086013 RepID=A0A1N7PE06_9RHOB|nr:hemin uptake protein HemP [Gemmobacter megaterium]GGE18853.1 hemin uptake protein HemP [Gemmobacter megaterium]SIT08776.1 Hemin uptake protein HemP [Gemmobacter megaterium]